MSSDHSPISATFSLRHLHHLSTSRPQSNSITNPTVSRQQLQYVTDLSQPIRGQPQPPQLIGNRSQFKTFAIIFSSVRVINIHPLKHRVDGTADPYLRLIPSFSVNGMFEAPHRKRTTDPMWRGGEIPVISIDATREELEKQHVTLQCLDLGLRGEEDLLGACSVPLAIGFGEEPMAFRGILTRQTRRVGAVFGRVCVTEVSDLPREGSISQQDELQKLALTKTTSSTAVRSVSLGDYHSHRADDAQDSPMNS